MSYISRMYNHIAYIRLIYTYTCNRVINTCAHTIRLLSINRRLYFARVYVLQRQYVRSISMRQTRIAYIPVRIISFVVIVRRMLTIIITSTVTITINDNNSSNNLAHTQSVLGDDSKRTMHTIKFVINGNWTFVCALQKMEKIHDFLEKFYNVYALYRICDLVLRRRSNVFDLSLTSSFDPPGR